MRWSRNFFVIVYCAFLVAGISHDFTLADSAAQECGPRIAFTSGLEGIEDVYIMHLNATGLENLTNRGDASDPVWSPDGSKIAFVGFGDSGNRDIYVANADGSDQVQLTDNGLYIGDDYPVWSPDGTQIAFASYRDGNWEVYVMNADGTDPINLTENDASDGGLGLAWSPDGRKIVFTSDRDAEKRTDTNFFTNLYVLDLETKEVVRLTEDNRYTDEHPDWSPDGRQIVFVSYRNPAGWSGIFVIDADGSNLAELKSENAESYVLYQFPAWSPDGQRIAYTACAEHRLGKCEIFVMDANGSNVVQLTDDFDADLQPAWEPVSCEE